MGIESKMWYFDPGLVWTWDPGTRGSGTWGPGAGDEDVGTRARRPGPGDQDAGTQTPGTWASGHPNIVQFVPIMVQIWYHILHFCVCFILQYLLPYMVSTTYMVLFCSSSSVSSFNYIFSFALVPWVKAGNNGHFGIVWFA